MCLSFCGFEPFASNFQRPLLLRQNKAKTGKTFEKVHKHLRCPRLLIPEMDEEETDEVEMDEEETDEEKMDEEVTKVLLSQPGMNVNTKGRYTSFVCVEMKGWRSSSCCSKEKKF